MREEHWIGLGVVVALLALVSLLISVWSAVLAGLILLSVASAALLFSRVVHVQERTDLIVCSQQHNAVLRVVRGPATTVLAPLREKAGAVIDTVRRELEVRVENVLQHDGQPAMYSFSVWVWFHLAPHELTLAQLAEILPDLMRPEPLIRNRTDSFLRRLMTDPAGSPAHNGGRCPVERRLTGVLESTLRPMGITIERVQLIPHPPAALRQSVTEAEQYRVTAAPRLETFDSLLRAAGGQPQGAGNLAAMELASALTGNGRPLTTVDVGSLLRLLGSGYGAGSPSGHAPDSH